MGNLCLLLYTLAWSITLVRYFRKKHEFDIACIIISTYIIYGVSSYCLYNSQIGVSRYNITLFPLIYLFTMLWLVIKPFYKVRFKGMMIQRPSSHKINLLAMFLIVFAILPLPNIIMNFQQNIMMVILDSTAGMERYMDMQADAETFGDSVSNIPSIIQGAFADFCPFLLFYYLSLPKKNKWIIIGLILSCITPALSAIASAGRGGIIRVLMNVFCAYVFFCQMIDKKILHYIKLSIILIISLASIPLIAITVSRFGEDDAHSSMLEYVGQGVLNFTTYGLDANGIRYGDRTINLFKRVIAPDTPKNFMERREKYKHMKIGDESFYTYVGDFTLDFGPILAFVLFVAFSVFASKRIYMRNNTLFFHQLILLYFIACVCIQGGMSLFTFSDIGGGLRLIVFACLYKWFKRDGYKSKLLWQNS